MPDGTTPTSAGTIDTTISKTSAKTAIHGERALQSVRQAVLLLTLARKACGEDADEIDLPLVRQAVSAAKDHMHVAIDQINDLVPDRDDPLYNALSAVNLRLYDPWDAILILLIAMPYRAARNSTRLSICPIAGTLNIIRDRVDQLADELTGVIETFASSRTGGPAPSLSSQ